MWLVSLSIQTADLNCLSGFLSKLINRVYWCSCCAHRLHCYTYLTCHCHQHLKHTHTHRKTYKQADKHVLFWVVHPPFAILVLLRLLSHQWQTGFLDIVEIEAAMKTAGRVVAEKTMFQITRVAVTGDKGRDDVKTSAE